MKKKKRLTKKNSIYVERIVCGNCGAEIYVGKKVKYNTVLSFICHNCHKIREERLKLGVEE